MKNVPEIVQELREAEKSGKLDSTEDTNVVGKKNFGFNETFLYKMAVEESKDLIAAVDNNYVYILVNKAFLDFHQLKKEQVIGHSAEEILGKDYFKKEIKHYVDKCLKGEYVRFNSTFDHPTKGKYYTDISYYPIKNKDENVVGVVSHIRDITSQKKTESQIKENEKRLKEKSSHFKKLFYNVPDPAVIIDSKGKILEINNKITKLTGYNRENYIGKNFFKTNIVSSKTKLLLMKNLVKRMFGKEIKPYEIEVIGKDGGKIPFEINATKIDFEGKSADLVVLRDISEQRKHSRQVKKILEAVRDGVRIVDRDFNVLNMNKTIEEMTEISRENGIGMKCNKMFGSKRCGTKNCSLIRVLKTGEKFQEEDIRVNKNGKKFICIVNVTPIKDNHGNITGIIEDFQDITKIKNNEKKIKESEQKFRQFFELSPDYCYMVDFKGKILDINKSALNILGYEKKDIIGKQVIPTIYAPSSQKRAKELVKKWLDEGKLINEEIDINTKEGVKTVLLSVDNVTDVNDNLLYSILMQKDISDIRKTQQKLKESEEKFRQIVESSPDAITISDLEGNIIECNQATLILHGYSSKEEVIGMNSLKFIAPEDHGKAMEGMKKVLEKGSQRNIEYTFITKDGKKFPAELSSSVIKNSFDEPIAFIAITKDISKRKKDEKELQLRNRAIETSINAISITDSKGRINYINPSFTEMLGVQKEQVIGEPISKFYYRKDKYKKIMDTLVKENGWIGEVKAKRKDGTNFYVQLSASLIKDENGKILSTMYSFIDITEKKKMERSLKESRRKIKLKNIELKKLDRIKSDFLNVTSHELRTPMSAIKGYIQMILKQTMGEITEEQKKALNVVLRNTNRLDHLIRDILDVSRLESGTMNFISKKTNIRKLTKEVAETMKSSAEEKNIKINTEIDSDIPKLDIDKERIKQVMINILNNAIKFSKPDTDIDIKVKKQKKHILFKIKDQGRGISKDKLKKVFDAFYQVEYGKTRSFGGAGLGLAISRGIIMSHGGKIWAESKKGKGSTFIFKLPIKPVEHLEERFKKIDVFKLENEKELKKDKS